MATPRHTDKNHDLRHAVALPAPWRRLVVAPIIWLLATGVLGVLSTPDAFAQQSPHRVEVRVLPMAEVGGPQYTLGEVAEIESDDFNLVKELAALILGHSPRAGRILWVNESNVRSRLAKVMDPAQVNLFVPKKAQVQRVSQKIPGEKIAEQVLEHARRASGALEGDFQHKVLTRLREVVLPQGQVIWDISPLGRKATPGGVRSYRVKALVADKVEWQGMVRVALSLFKDVVVARRPLNRNQMVSAEDVEIKRAEVGRLKEESYLTRLEDVVGKRTRRPIGAGEWIHQKIVQSMPDVREGNRVNLVFKTKNLLFQVPGVAMTNGRVGAFIPVRNLQSGKIVYGVVQSIDSVLVN